MYVAVVPFTAYAGKMEEFKALIDDIGQVLLEDHPGYQGGYVLQQPGNDDELLVIHMFDTEADANAGPASDRERAIFGQIAGLVDLEKAVADRTVYQVTHRIARSNAG